MRNVVRALSCHWTNAFFYDAKRTWSVESGNSIMPQSLPASTPPSPEVRKERTNKTLASKSMFLLIKALPWWLGGSYTSAVQGP